MLFLHIGLHKTGTTFLQQAVFPKWQGINYIPEDKLEFLVRMDEKQDYLLSREGLSGKNWAHAEERAKNINKLNTTSTMGVRSKFASDLSLGFLLKFINP